MDNNDNIVKNESLNNLPEMVSNTSNNSVVNNNNISIMNQVQDSNSINSVSGVSSMNSENVPVMNPMTNEAQPVMMNVDTTVNEVIPTMIPAQNMVNPISSSVNPTSGYVTNSVGTVPTLPTMNPDSIVSVNGNHVAMQDVQPRTVFQTDASYSEDSNQNKGKVIENQVEEKKMVSEVEYKPLSKVKVFGVIFLFTLLIGFVIFLPEITTYVEKFLSGEKEVVYEKITTGKLICKYETTTTDTTINYEMTYSFSNNKLEKLKYVTISRIDPSEDSGTMDSLISKCLLLKQETESVSGVSVRCEDEPSILTVTQNFDFEKLDKEKLSSAYDEAGGTYPEYEFEQDMDGIERNMNAIEYTCHREK